MPTIGELIERLKYMIDDDIDNTTAIRLFNEAQEDVSEYAGYAITAETPFMAGISTVGLPTDLIEIVEIKMKTTQDDDFLRVLPDSVVKPLDVLQAKIETDYTSFEWFGDSITLIPSPEFDGTLQIRYYANLPEIPTNDLNFVPALRTRFHKLLSTYAAFRYFQNWQDEMGAKNDYYQEYILLKQELMDDTDQRKIRTKSKTVYQLRQWK